ncbi:gamma-aminobutyric acid type B receptor subunit 1-like [Amphiura filiformis]|uniref:gamma-aminobutyric acid type B receptor subunit 1-like n=1 Tax=Amphiura filiformis TaxID=82378 RepID=UPI003B21D006
MFENNVRVQAFIGFILCIACITAANLTTTTSNVGKTPIYIGGFFSHGGAWDASGILPAVAMGLDHINEREDILPDYDLRMVWNDTQCDPSLGTRVLFDQLYNEPQKLLLAGDGCSISSQAIAGTAYHWNLNTVSYAASSPALSNRDVYPYFFRTIMPDTMFNPARIRLLREFGWNKVGVIHGKEEIESLAADDLLDLLEEANITVLTSETFASEDPYHQVQNLKNVDAKIIISNMYASKGRRTLCEAYRNNLIGPGYMWLMVGWYPKKWWEVEDDTVTCSMEEMRRAARSTYYISTESLQLSTSPDITVADITAAEYVILLQEYMNDTEWAGYTWHNDNPFGYDAAWAIGLMLDKAVYRLKEMGLQLEDFTYDDKEMAKVFFELLKETDFLGVSGPVSFRDGDRIGYIQIRQLQAGCDDSSWKLHNDDCFLFINEPLPYSDAQEYCQSSESHLAAIINEPEYYFVVNQLRNNTEWKESHQWFIGLRSNGQSYEWDDLRFRNETWVPPGSELSSALDGRCVYTSTNLPDGWTSIRCDEKLPFICRKESEFLERPIALFLEDGGYGILEQTGTFIWPGGKMPLDHTPILRVYRGIHSELYGTMCFLSIMGILLAVIFLVFNLKYRKQKFVKLSSPNLNNLIILGSVLVYISIFIGGIDSNLVTHESFGVSCQLRVWFLSVGFVVAFGSMFSKTWRVHKVAAFKTPKRMIITDNQLFLMVLVLVLVDIFLLMLWSIIDPLVVMVQELPEKEDANQRIVPYFEYCSSEFYIYWMVPLFGYKIILLVFGAFLAWEVRKVKVSALNDSKLIGISVYNVVVLCTIGVSVSFVISNDPATLYTFTSLVVLFCTTITLLIVFIPKVVSVYKYPEGPPTLTSGIKFTSPKPSSAIRENSSVTWNDQKSTASVAQVAVENEPPKDSVKSTDDKNGIQAGIVVGGGCRIWCAGREVWSCCTDSSDEEVEENKPSSTDGASDNGGNINKVKIIDSSDAVHEESKPSSPDGARDIDDNLDKKTITDDNTKLEVARM